jgi:hypothetical protein
MSLLDLSCDDDGNPEEVFLSPDEDIIIKVLEMGEREVFCMREA